MASVHLTSDSESEEHLYPFECRGTLNFCFSRRYVQSIASGGECTTQNSAPFVLDEDENDYDEDDDLGRPKYSIRCRLHTAVRFVFMKSRIL